MNSAVTATPASKGLNILVIRAADCSLDERSLSKLLDDAGLKVASITLSTPAEIASGAVNPKDSDHVIALLDNELAGDGQLQDGMLGVAQCGMGVIGIWPEGADTDDMHPALQKFGAKQIPWDAEQLSEAMGSVAPETFQSSSGGSAAKHDTTHNKC